MSSRMRVYELIRANLDEIVAEWAILAKKQLPAAADVPPLALLDHVPELLQDLTDWLESGGRRSVAEFWEEARQHATSRLRQDFDVSQITHEYRILRGVLTRRMVASQKELDSLGDLALMDEAIDIAITEAVNRYSKTRERLISAEVERLRLALQAGDVGMWDWLPKEDTVTWDDRTRALFDVAPDVTVNYERFLAALHPDDRNAVDTLLQDKLRSDVGGDDYRVEFRVDDGRWLEARGRVLERDEQGYASRFIGTVLEVTDRKRQERDRAEDAEFLERFVAIVSHDLRNPLQAIGSAASLLLASDELPDALTRNVGRIASNVQRMTRLIAELLDLTRSRLGGGIPVDPRPANLQDIAAGVIEDLAFSHPHREIVTTAKGDLDGNWDPDRLAQALGNLVVNALEHGAAERPVRVELAGDAADRVSATVRNEGEPIPSGDLSQIFEPFRRGPHGGAGLGLGLFIAKEIARAHGGRIAVASTKADGTTFSLTLPRRSPRGS